MSETTTANPTYYGHEVWTNEDGETYYLPGHVPQRRAIAAANRYARVECGFVNLADDPDAPLSWITVRHVWWKPAPNDWPGWEEGAEEGAMLPCHADEQGAEAFTEVNL